MRTMGIVLTGVGAAGLVASSVLLATAKEPLPPACDPCLQFCPDQDGFPGNCVGPPVSSQKVVGSAIFGASLATALIGAPVLAYGAAPEPIEVGPRKSDAMLLAGIGLTAFGAAATTGGALLGIASRGSSSVALALPLALLGTGSMLVGIPVWSAGTKRVADPNLTDIRWIPHNRKMVVAGVALTAVGAAIAGGGATILSFASQDRTARELSAALGFGGLGLAFTGIPLWYVGQEYVPIAASHAVGARSPQEYVVASAEEARPPRPSPARARAAARELPPPEIQIGPTSVGMRLSF